MELGSCVMTSKGHYFMAISAGKALLEETEIFIISPLSPIGQAMQGMKQNDNFKFRGQSFDILQVF